MDHPSFTNARAFLRNCYRPLKLRGKSRHALRLHECTLNSFARFLGREPDLPDLNSETISFYLTWLRDRGRAAITANDNLNRLMALARFAVLRRQLPEVPIVEPEIEPERVVRAWLLSDLETLFSTLLELPGTICGAPASLWWSTLHLVLLFTGERISAVVSLRWDQVDLKARWMMLTAEQRKGKKRDKEWPLPEVVIAALVQLKKTAKTPLVFERDFCMGTLYNRYAKILLRAKLPTDRNSKFHRMRKSTASHFAAAGGNPTELLDHSGPRVTRKYLDRRIVREKSAADLLSAPLAALEFFR